MTFSQLATYFDKLEKTASRLTITEILADLFNKVSVDEIDKVLYLLQGRVTPLFIRLDFGLGEKMVIKSIIRSLQIDENYFLKEYRKTGDLGLTVEHFKKQIQNFDTQDLSITQVYDRLYQICKISGIGSVVEKTAILGYLISTLDSLSVRYLVRIPVNTLRLGFSDMTMLDSFSWMLKKDKSLRSQIESAYHVRPDLGYIGKLIKQSGIKNFNKVKPKIFTPIIMMRAERLTNAKDIIEKVSQGVIEPKFDGFRLQVHYKKLHEKSEVRLYSRNLDDVTFMYPDIVAGIEKQIKATEEVIIEGEAIGYDPKNNKFLPFQETVTRKRKYDIGQKSKDIPLKIFVFELLYLNGISYLNEQFVKRRKLLNTIIRQSKNPIDDVVQLTDETRVTDSQHIEEEFEKAVSDSLEGIMVKKDSGIYQPGARGWNWIKYKKSYASKIGDTIDCVVMGYDTGKGKRVGFGIGAFLVGVYGENNDQYLTVAKIGTGLTDEEWRQLKVQSAKFKVAKKPIKYLVDNMMDCDVWIKPEIVVEIKADEITVSPVHSAGYALRFPRLIRFRDDKKPEDITSLSEIVKLYKLQKNS